MKYIGCKQGIYFRFFMALNGDISKPVQKKSQKAASHLPKALQRNKKKYQRRRKMHTHYIKVYHEINVTVVQKHELKTV